MKTENMTSSRGHKVANQFIITHQQPNQKIICFQSYKKIIVRKVLQNGHLPTIQLDELYWDYSKTTGKYRNLFLGESKAETQKKIDSGKYILTNLN